MKIGEHLFAKLKKQILVIKQPFLLNVIANVFSYFIAFCGSIIYVHMLGKINFGLYTFSFNIISLFLLVNGFGAASGVLQYVSRSEDDEVRQSYLRLSFHLGSIFNAAISFLIILYAIFTPLPLNNVRPILLGMALFPIGRLYIDVFQAYLRACGKSTLQAQFSILNNAILLAVNLIGIAIFSLYGLIYSTYIAYVIMFFYSSWKFQLPSVFRSYKYQSNLSGKQIELNLREFVSYSFFSTLSNAFSGLLFVLDIVIIGYVIKDSEAVAAYKIATLIPFAINFIPGIIVTYYYPEFAKIADNRDKLKSLVAFIRKRMFIFSFVVSIFLIILAKPIIFILFGSGYSDSILPFQIVSFGYWIIATFRIINGNVLAALGRAKLSFGITAFMLVLNIAITYFMVSNYSIYGAAMAIVIIYSISSFISSVVLRNIMNNMDID